MSKARWRLALTQSDGLVGIKLIRGSPGPGSDELVARWSVDADAETIAELLRDLASELMDEARDGKARGE
jgi:hypothetical protein